ncbi:PEP-CTERM sorting domain-containing protein [Microcoleus sp. N9_B4]|uniref:PEP-CTERM sorting domain-containing protein n=1 Tax=Microcoleus sp. N9_B4 TaxID=3055386 RepID=UPI002FD5B191
MCQKLRPRLGSAIASTILSLFSAVSLVGIDKAQAAVLTYNLDIYNGGGSGFLKVDNSSVNPILFQLIPVSEGRLYTPLILDSFGLGGKEYYNLAGAIAIFYEGVLRGLQAGGSDTRTRELIVPPDEPGGPDYINIRGYASWSIDTYVQHYRGISFIGGSWLLGYKEVYITPMNSMPYVDRQTIDSAGVVFTLVNTEPEPVPEPLTVGGTALALAGLSWLKQKKKMAA